MHYTYYSHDYILVSTGGTYAVCTARNVQLKVKMWQLSLGYSRLHNTTWTTYRMTEMVKPYSVAYSEACKYM